MLVDERLHHRSGNQRRINREQLHRKEFGGSGFDSALIQIQLWGRDLLSSNELSALDLDLLRADVSRSFTIVTMENLLFLMGEVELFKQIAQPQFAAVSVGAGADVGCAPSARGTARGILGQLTTYLRCLQMAPGPAIENNRIAAKTLRTSAPIRSEGAQQGKMRF